MTITTPYLDPKAFMSSLKTNYDFSYTKKWNAHYLEIPKKMGNGNLHVFLRDQAYFIRLKIQNEKPMAFYSPDQVGGNGLIDFRFSSNGDLVSAVLEEKKKYEWEINSTNRFAVFLPKTEISCNLQELRKKFERSLFNPNIKYLADEVFKVATNDGNSSMLLESKILEFTHVWIDYLNHDRSYISILPPHKMDALKLVKNEINEHLVDPPSLHKLSKLAGMNINDLQCNFKKIYGLTIRQYLISKRMKKAKELVLFSHQSILDICEKVGYSNRGHFSQLYTQYYGLSPLQHRLKYR